MLDFENFRLADFYAAVIYAGMGSRTACTGPRPVVFEVKAKAKTSDYKNTRSRQK